MKTVSFQPGKAATKSTSTMSQENEIPSLIMAQRWYLSSKSSLSFCTTDVNYCKKPATEAAPLPLSRPNGLGNKRAQPFCDKWGACSGVIPAIANDKRSRCQPLGGENKDVSTDASTETSFIFAYLILSLYDVSCSCDVLKYDDIKHARWLSWRLGASPFDSARIWLQWSAWKWPSGTT